MCVACACKRNTALALPRSSQRLYYRAKVADLTFPPQILKRYSAHKELHKELRDVRLWSGASGEECVSATSQQRQHERVGPIHTDLSDRRHPYLVISCKTNDSCVTTDPPKGS